MSSRSDLRGTLRTDATDGVTAITRLETGGRPSSVVAIDIDEDGHVDLVTADLESDEVSIFYGRGRGVFADRVALDRRAQTRDRRRLRGTDLLEALRKLRRGP